MTITSSKPRSPHQERCQFKSFSSPRIIWLRSLAPPLRFLGVPASLGRLALGFDGLFGLCCLALGPGLASCYCSSSFRLSRLLSAFLSLLGLLSQVKPVDEVDATTKIFLWFPGIFAGVVALPFDQIHMFESVSVDLRIEDSLNLKLSLVADLAPL